MMEMVVSPLRRFLLIIHLSSRNFNIFRAVPSRRPGNKCGNAAEKCPADLWNVTAGLAVTAVSLIICLWLATKIVKRV